MKTIGLIGGMSWKSSLEYYRIINELIQERLGDWHCANLIMYSVNFQDIDLEHATREWMKSDKIIINAAKMLEKAGADFLVIGCNTAHVMADQIQASIKIPLLHIVDATAQKIKAAGYRKVGLLGTRFTMKKGFYRDRLKKKFNLEVITPNEKEGEIINKAINAFILNKKNSDGKKQIAKIIDNLKKQGAECIILGCTELPSIISNKDSKLPLFDTTKIHAEYAVYYALK